MHKFRKSVSAITLLAAALLTSGCEAALFGVLNRKAAPPERSVMFDAVNKLSLDVYAAENIKIDSAPIVVFFYGGSWQRGERDQYRFVGRQLAKNGILAIVADYRKFPRAEFPYFVDDAAHAVAWAQTHAAELGGDPKRVFIAGHSAGAQIAALLGTDAHYLASAGVKAQDISGVIGLSGPYDFDITGKYVKIFGPPSQWPNAQAVNFVDGNEPPFLLIHGQRDRVVEYSDSVELFEKLKQKDEPATLLLLPEAGHFSPVMALYNPARDPKVLAAILEFVRDPDAN